MMLLRVFAAPAPRGALDTPARLIHSLPACWFVA
jgi:hypothetical protein